MGILSSSASITRYRVKGTLADPVMDTLRQGLSRYTIEEIDDAVDEKSMGWTSFQNSFDPQFEDASFIFGTYLVFALRIDKKSIPSKVVKKHYRQALARLMGKGSTSFLSRDEKKRVKQEVFEHLSLRIPATPSIFDVLWDLENGSLHFFSTQKAANEALETLFKQSFDLNLVRMFPYTMADMLPGMTDAQRDVLNTLNPASLMR